MKNKVSIIVPIYNVEKFLRECIESLINQSYENIEIILINDDSPDNSKSICEEYQKKDNRIKLYNKENGGLSDARNFGIEKSTGEYLIFVDSDDVIDRNYIKILLDNSVENDAEICICNFEKFEEHYHEDLATIHYKKSIYLPSEFIKEILCVKKNSYAWGTLIKKKIFGDIRFKKGIRFEDIEMMYKLYMKSNRIIFVDLPLYKYRQQENSIVHKYNVKNMIDYTENCKSFCLNVQNRYPELKKYVNQFMCNAYSMAVCSSLNNKNELDKYQKELKVIVKKTKFYELPFQIYIKLLLFKYNTNLATKILKLKNQEKK